MFALKNKRKSIFHNIDVEFEINKINNVTYDNYEFAKLPQYKNLLEKNYHNEELDNYIQKNNEIGVHVKVTEGKIICESSSMLVEAHSDEIHGQFFYMVEKIIKISNMLINDENL
ncbi:MAG: hypothetical protein J6C46_06715 [Clostridia bacterium]|nr:hypothetical protein [Clostridia bacterium]